MEEPFSVKFLHTGMHMEYLNTQGTFLFVRINDVVFHGRNHVELLYANAQI